MFQKITKEFSREKMSNHNASKINQRIFTGKIVEFQKLDFSVKLQFANYPKNFDEKNSKIKIFRQILFWPL